MEVKANLAKLTDVDLINDRPDEQPKTVPDSSPLPTPDNPPWNTPAAIGVWIASVVLILLLPNLLLLPYLVSRKVQFGDSAKLVQFLLSDPTAIIINILAIIPAHVLTFALGWVTVTRFRKFSFRETLGWRTGGMRWWHYLAILVGFFAIGALVGNYFPEQENDLSRILKSSRTAVYIIAFMATFTAPIVEELVYRGILYSAFQRSFGVPAAVFAVTCLFALVHVPQYLPSYSTIFLLTLLSLVLTLVRARTGNLLPCILLHFVFNGVQSAALILEPFLSDSKVNIPEPTSIIIRLLM